MKEKRDFEDQTFQMTGKDLDAYCIHMVLPVLASLLAGVAAVLILEIAVEPLLGPPEGWTGARAAASMLLVTLATLCGICVFWNRRRERWLEKRRVLPQGGGD